MGDHVLGVLCLDVFDAPFPDFTGAEFGAPRPEPVPLARFSYGIERRLSQLVFDAAKAGVLDAATLSLTMSAL